jgi:hypothetical protein
VALTSITCSPAPSSIVVENLPSLDTVATAPLAPLALSRVEGLTPSVAEGPARRLWPSCTGAWQRALRAGPAARRTCLPAEGQTNGHSGIKASISAMRRMVSRRATVMPW